MFKVRPRYLLFCITFCPVLEHFYYILSNPIHHYIISELNKCNISIYVEFLLKEISKLTSVYVNRFFASTPTAE